MTIWICIFITIWVLLLSRANVKITMIHKEVIPEPEPELDPDDVAAQQKALEDYYNGESKTLPSFDEVLQEVNTMLRGDADES